MTTHPNIRFQVTGYWNEDSRNTDGQMFEVAKQFPLGSTHDHIPRPQVRYRYLFDSESPAEYLAQSLCQICYPREEATDNRKAPGA